MISIRDIQVTLTAPMGRNLLVVRVLTTEPELSGLGCGTFTQRYLPVASTINDHLKPLLIGRDATQTEELFRLMMVNGYWRNGPVLNNAVAAIDIALWDLKAKLAGLPLYQLLGGKMREGAAVYQHADGRSLNELADHTQAQIDRGMRHVRIRFGGGSNETRASGEAGGLAYGGALTEALNQPDGAPGGAYFDPTQYMRSTLEALEHIRRSFGDSIELLHDTHCRLTSAQAIAFSRDLEGYRLFFLEDVLPPEDLAWYQHVRANTTTPQAVGELFNNPNEWTPLIANRWIDFIRMHTSHMGGLTPARKVAALAEAFGVRVAWHGPGDLSPIGHAANLHLNLTLPNFGVQELQPFTPETEEVFPGCPVFRNGYLYPNERPGHGVDLDEKVAARYPCDPAVIGWTQARLPDGSITWP
ncbi:enolase C-terminal domain-like protein [Mucisphaera sp.]|uniref:enolase C-terminal domain-like protein n=1 Tax=Mucisphaera sp. TaxID=2913024 RepID=UPI003D0C9FA5